MRHSLQSSRRRRGTNRNNNPNPTTITGGAKRGRGSKQTERGSVLVELTMVLPLLVTVVLGMMEMGMAWRDQQTITQASRQGARVGSHLGDDATADQQAVEAALAVLDDDQLDNINYIVVYEVPASNPSGVIPAGCKTASNSGLNCTRYSPTDIANGTFDGTSWDPTGRKVTMSGDGPDRLGVYISVFRPWFTGYFPGTGTDIGVHSVMQLEPDIS